MYYTTNCRNIITGNMLFQMAYLPVGLNAAFEEGLYVKHKTLLIEIDSIAVTVEFCLKYHFGRC